MGKESARDDETHKIEEQKLFVKQVATLLATQKKLFKTRQYMANVKQPILWLQRTDGSWDKPYTGVRGSRFTVPGLPAGVEKEITIGPKWQVEWPYANTTFKAYICHEDWAFPFVWGKPNVYKGKFPSLIKDKVSKEAYDKGQIPMILDNANINSESMRDRERKILTSWEKYKTTMHAINWAAYGKFIFYAGLVVALGMFIYYMWGPKEVVDAAQVAEAAARAAMQKTGIIME